MKFGGEINKNKIEQKRPTSLETAKGSVYQYLPDGRTQRFKKVENKQYEPQDVIVFIPDWITLKTNAPSNFLERFEGGETGFVETMLEYCKEMKVYVIDNQGNKISSNKEKEDKAQLLLAFCKDPESSPDFVVPVSPKPKENWFVYDTRKYFNQEKGQWEREQHIGNKVVKINY